jgi:hypothetical protein
MKKKMRGKFVDYLESKNKSPLMKKNDFFSVHLMKKSRQKWREQNDAQWSFLSKCRNKVKSIKIKL